jgi:hypothetical protein
MITHERLKEVMHYDPETGTMTWIKPTARRVHIGDTAGCPCTSGHLQVKIDGRFYMVHRLAWLYMTGEWPPKDIDHEDLDNTNNRWKNLRRATESQNRANSKKLSTNTSGLKGVVWHKRDRIFEAKLGFGGKYLYLGRFDCPAAASFAYQIEADKRWGEFARID